MNQFSLRGEKESLGPNHVLYMSNVRNVDVAVVVVVVVVECLSLTDIFGHILIKHLATQNASTTTTTTTKTTKQIKEHK